MKDGVGYDASTCSDRVDTIEDLIAKDDRVWAVWTMRGTHTGQLFGIPATGQPIEILEAGIWRLVDGLVIEAWFFGDELRLLRQPVAPNDPPSDESDNLPRRLWSQVSSPANPG
jgi:hypothetical protein